MWAIELTRNVPCQRSTVDKKKPIKRPPHPNRTRLAIANDHGPIQLFRSSQRSSGNAAKSLMPSRSVSLYFVERIQPTWLHQNPSRGECTSPSRSV